MTLGNHLWPLSGYLAHEARSADLILTGIGGNASIFYTANRPGVGNLVMQAGRPTLVLPALVSTVALKHVLVGWNDTKEARRAISDRAIVAASRSGDRA